MEYIYLTSIFFDTEKVLGINPTTEQANTTDFETNYKNSTFKIDGLQISETAVLINKTYTEFKALITGDITWSLVKCLTKDKNYELYIITDNQL